MRTSFSDIIIEVLEREGGFVNHRSDRGGPTKFGVTLETLKRHHIDIDGDGDIDQDDVKALPLEAAKKLYEDQYWKPARCGEIPEKIRELYFDMVINHGQANAVRILQSAASYAGRKIKIDGIIGPKTIEASKSVRLEFLVRLRIQFYIDICRRDASQLVFLGGWINNRCIDFLI